MSEGKIEQLIKQKRAFLKASVKDYSAGGNDMLDDVEALLEEAKAEITQPFGACELFEGRFWGSGLA